MKSFPLSLSLFAFASLLSVSHSTACDICSIYTPSLELTPAMRYTWFLGVQERFTHYGTVQEDGHEIGNPLDQHLDSSITQAVVGGWFLDDRLGLQLNAPYIYRSYARAGHFITEHGHESGFGDMSLLATYVLFRTEHTEPTAPAPLGKDAKSVLPEVASAEMEPDFSGWFAIKGGVKAPTGNSDRIGEELTEHDHHGFAASAVHGHDLALGSGSWDGIVGAEAYVRHRSLFFTAEVQYFIRSEGDFDYEYANDLSWDFGPGVFFLRDPDRSVALQVLVSGEDKGEDTFHGENEEGTAVTYWYVGPRLTASFGRWSAEAGVDLPVSLDNSGVQAVPDYRIHAGLTFHF
jgi:hypothetical protein